MAKRIIFIMKKKNNDNPVLIYKDLSLNSPYLKKGDSLPKYMNNMEKSVF